MNEPNNTAATVFVYRHKATGEVAAHYTDAACIKQALPDWKLVASLDPRLWIQANWRQAGAIPMPDPSAHIYPSDLERFKTDETFGHAYSVAVGNPDERSVPLYTLSDLVAYSLALVAEERARCADLAAPERFVYSDEEWRVRCEIRDAINEPQLDDINVADSLTNRGTP